MSDKFKDLEIEKEEAELLLDCVLQAIELLKRHGWEPNELRVLKEKLNELLKQY